MQALPNLPLERQLASILSANREGSYATQDKRGQVLGAAARALVAHCGLQKWENLKQKHMMFIVETWKAEDTGHRSINTKLSCLRWLVQKIGKANLVPRSNAELGVDAGPRHTRAGKVITENQFAQVLINAEDKRVQGMLLLARRLGMRFKEAALWRPNRDCDGSRVWIKRGTKGGRPRYLFIHNPGQVEAINWARSMVKAEDGCLIPKEFRTFEQWRQYVYRQLRAAGLGREGDRTFHDLRRTYLVERLKDLGTRMDRHRAAQLVAREAGHGRTEVLDWYVAAPDTELESAA